MSRNSTGWLYQSASRFIKRRRCSPLIIIWSNGLKVTSKRNFTINTLHRKGHMSMPNLRSDALFIWLFLVVFLHLALLWTVGSLAETNHHQFLYLSILFIAVIQQTSLSHCSSHINVLLLVGSFHSISFHYWSRFIGPGQFICQGFMFMLVFHSTISLKPFNHH